MAASWASTGAICRICFLLKHLLNGAGMTCDQVIDEADRMMDEIKQDWLSLVDKAVYHEQSTADSRIYLNTCQRLAPGPLTLEKYDKLF